MASAFALDRRKDGVWVLTFDTPGEKVNKLSQQVMTDFGRVLDELEKELASGSSGCKALVLKSGKKNNFIAGADLDMLQAAKTAADAQALSAGGHALMNRWEDLPVPTVAAIDGPALGGGCEFALACTAIVMSQDPAARIGLPEVLLGIVPGMGGCVRLPRKIGIAGALDMILTGKNLTADKAFKSGVAEASVAAQDFEGNALAWVNKNLDALTRGQRLAREPKLGGMGGMAGTLLEKTPPGRMVVYKQARAGVMAQTKGKYPAPLAAIRILEATSAGYGPKLKGKAREKALAVEARTFGELAVSEVSHNLVRLFFMTEAVKKTNGLPVGNSTQPKRIGHGGVLGAGIMGGGIAQLMADKGIAARMKDVTPQALALGVQAATKLFDKQVKRRKISRREFIQKLNLIAPVLDYEGFRGVDVVVEAIVENIDIKKKVFAELETQVSDTCIIASNTSSLSISKMQEALKRPERFVGMHFFNPVHRMPLVEVIRGQKTSDEAVATIFQLSKSLGKTPIVVKDSAGFLVNRILGPYLNEATYLLADGVGVEEMDRVLLDFGMPMGPMELVDEVGIDVGAKVAHILNDAFGPRMQACTLNQKLLDSKRLGRKNSKGLYDYTDPKNPKKKHVDPAVYGILGVTPQKGALPAEEILERCVLPMINEASRCLDEGVVAASSEVDLGMIMGTGFPPFRGGLLRYADSLGAKHIVERLGKYQGRFGARFEPSAKLVTMAQHDQRFYPA